MRQGGRCHDALRPGRRVRKTALYRWLPVDRPRTSPDSSAEADPSAKTETSSDATPEGPEEALAPDVRDPCACGAAYALFKPPNIVTTMSKAPSQLSGGASLSAWLSEIQAGLQPIGRLDKNTSGLLLAAPRRLVAAINAAVCSPGRCAKSYICCTDRPLSASALAKLQGGVALEEGVMKPLKVEELLPQRVPRVVRQLAKGRHPEVRCWHYILLEINVGWYHVVKRVMQAVGAPVLHLHRQGIAHMSLDSLRLLEPRTHAELPASTLGALLARGQAVPLAMGTALVSQAVLAWGRGGVCARGRGGRLPRGNRALRTVQARGPSRAPSQEVLRRRKGGCWHLSLGRWGLDDVEAETFAKETLRPWLAEQQGPVVFSSLELSENPALGARGLSAILAELSLEAVSVHRLKFFRTAADDEALCAVAEWMTRLPAGHHPSEVHFSHCQVGDTGLLALLRAAASRGGKTLWAQLARNSVSAGLVESLAAAGAACLAHDRPACGPRGCKLERSPLVHLSGGRAQRGAAAAYRHHRRRGRSGPVVIEPQAIEAAVAKWRPVLAELVAGEPTTAQTQGQGSKEDAKIVEVVEPLEGQEEGKEEETVAEEVLQLEGQEERKEEETLAEVVAEMSSEMAKGRMAVVCSKEGEPPIRLGAFGRKPETPCWPCMG